MEAPSTQILAGISAVAVHGIAVTQQIECIIRRYCSRRSWPRTLFLSSFGGKKKHYISNSYAQEVATHASFPMVSQFSLFFSYLLYHWIFPTTLKGQCDETEA